MRVLLALRPELLLCAIAFLLNARPCAVGVLTLADSLHQAVAPVGSVSNDLCVPRFYWAAELKLEWGIVEGNMA